MAVPLSTLIERLRSDVPPQSGTPTEMQYRAAVELAVVDFSEQLGRVKTVEISVVGGTADYTLPDDFISPVKVEGIFSGNIYIPPGGKIIPLGGNYTEESYSVSATTLTITPIPSYTATRELHYKAGFVMGSGDNYPDLTEHLAQIIAPKAAALILRQLAAGSSQGAFRFTFGDLTIDKSNAAKALSEAAGQLEAEYARLVSKQKGPIGFRAKFSAKEIASFLSP